MRKLEERILKDGKCLPGGVLKVDTFLNHQIDLALMHSCAEEFARLFADRKVDKVLTIEASGVVPAAFVGSLLHVPMVFAKKSKPVTMSDAYSAVVTSFTRKCDSMVVVSTETLRPGERVLVIDDLLAYGNAALGLADLCRQAGAEVVGFGFLVEKSFQGGRAFLAKALPGVRVESLAVISSLDDAIVGIDRPAETREPAALREDERILRGLQAELLAKIRGGADCGPFMAAIYDRDGRRLVEAVNSVVSSDCSHNHAEMNAIRLAEEKLGSWNLAPQDLVLYTTSEPCMMCMGGILWSGIRKVVYGVPSDRVEALTGFDEGFKPDWTIEFARRGIEVVGPLAAEDGEAVHREYMRLQKTVYAPGRIGK